MDFKPLPDDSPDLKGYDRPKMMAIGDSIYNGTRSLTTGPGLAHISAPAMVARGLGLSNQFIIPDYPRHVLFDLEQHLREGLSLKRLRSECVANAEQWLNSSIWSSRRFFDNIAIAGAEYKDLWENTSGYFKTAAVKNLNKLKNSDSFDFDTVINLYYAINASFLLNPSGDPDLDDLTPLEQAASRRPERLLINIGSNNGLFGIAISGNTARTGDDWKSNLDKIAEIPELAAQLAELLHKYCAGTPHIYFNLLIRPRALANLAPRTDEEMWNPPPDGGYFSNYVGRLGSLNGVSANQMKALDDLVAEVNAKTISMMGKILGERIHFIDLYAWAERRDRKHGTESEMTEVNLHGSNVRLSNYPLSVMLLGAGFRQGGLFSLDNMHPCTPAYALLANLVGDAVAQAENLPYRPFPLQNACDQDTLLQELPAGWDFLNFLAGLAGAFVKI